MKKRLIMTLMAGAVAMSLCACGGKDKAEDAANTTETAATEEDQTPESEVKVSDRPDYVGFEDLVIEDYVTLPEYASMTVQAEKPEVTDEVIENYINRNILTTYPVTDRAVAQGDAVTIDYVGKKDGVAFDGGTAEGYVLNIGSGNFIEGFEDGLVGVMPGETVDLNLTFPENYHAEELAGADVIFTVTVHDIQESTDYENVTQEQLALMENGYTSKEDIWENAEMKQMCEETIKQYLIIEAISRAEGIEVSEAAMKETAAKEEEEYGYESADALLEEVGKTTYRMYILQDEVMTKLMDMVTVEEAVLEEAQTEETTTEEAVQ